MTPVAGPAVSVTLDDAPASVSDEGIDADLLVVHQQDIQAVVNALWSGGAEAMTIQGQRVIATTGIKCVGNTVVLHGVPYAPPYVVSAIGEPAKLRAALAESPALQVYRQYVDAYALVYRERAWPAPSSPVIRVPSTCSTPKPRLTHLATRRRPAERAKREPGHHRARVPRRAAFPPPKVRK